MEDVEGVEDISDSGRSITGMVYRASLSLQGGGSGERVTSDDVSLYRINKEWSHSSLRRGQDHYKLVVPPRQRSAKHI